MNRRLALFVVVLSALFAASCDDNKSDNGIKLSEYNVSTSVLLSRTVTISGGSGGYKAQIDKSGEGIAVVSVTGDDKNILSIMPEKIGKTIVVVTDSEGEMAYLDLEVTSVVYKFVIESAEVVVEAEDQQVKEAIERDIMAGFPFPEGYCYALYYKGRTGGDMYVRESATTGSNVFSGEFTAGDETIVMKYDGKTFVYNTKIVSIGNTKSNIAVDKDKQRWLFIEDMAYYYRELYPEAGVLKAHRVQVCRF